MQLLKRRGGEEKKKKGRGRRKKKRGGGKAPCLVCHMDLSLLLAPASPKGMHGIPRSSPSTPRLVDTSLSPVAQAHKGREVLGGAASPTLNAPSALRQKIRFDIWIIWEFSLKETPCLSRVAGRGQCFQPLLLSTVHSSLWLLVFSTNDLSLL